MALSADRELHRTYLYAPGDKPAVIDKALIAGADAVILDLEDAVAPGRKSDARDEVARRLASAVHETPLHVRVSSADTAVDDLEAIAGPGLRGVRIPKVDSADQIAAVGAWITDQERHGRISPGVQIYPSVETAAVLDRIGSVLGASEHVARVVLGTADLVADLGLWDDTGTALIGHIQAELTIRSRAAGVGPPIDGAYPRLDDEPGLLASARQAKAFGFFGKSVIHPRQLAAVHATFTATPEQCARAERIIAAFERARADDTGTVAFEGLMLDDAVVARARALLTFRPLTEGPSR